MKPEVTAETNLNGKKTRTPKDAASITKGALNLPLEEKVALRNALSNAIDEEVKEKEQDYLQAKKLTGKE